ncbi:MAG: HlyC/CorC family transporter [Deltaproteobacteria bacterium]|nr:HlyC/CorC family transporter [Deltaproteobacteria bacterium]
MLPQLIILIVLIGLSAFFSSSETALFSISTIKARHIAKSESRTDRLIHKMKKNPHRLLTTILIGNNLVNVAAASYATAVTLTIFPNNAIGISTGVMTFLILIFGEIIPKSVATRNNIMLARMVIHPIHWLSILFHPIILFLNFIPKMTGKIKKTPSVTEEELKTFVEVVEEEGEIREEEREFIHNIIEFDDTSASEIMTPRGDMAVIEVNEPLDARQLLQSGFTRFPVIDGSMDNVIGIINIKDLFMRQTDSTGSISPKQIMIKPYFVPENKKLDSLLRQFKKRKQHMAIVVDEHGGVDGLITMEDVLEEIVGEISDETDKVETHITRMKKNEWIVLGKTEIEDVNETVQMAIPESKEFDTFSGYVLDHIGRIPTLNEKFFIEPFEIVVKKIDGNRIREYIVRRR